MIFDTAEEAMFRTEASTWLEAHLRADSRWAKADPMSGRNEEENTDYVAEAAQWQRVKYDHGWVGLSWPIRFGGRGLDPSFEAIFREEENFRVAHTAVFTVGIGMVGPILLAHGSTAQQDRFIPPLMRGDEIWCQLFSEPEAGSDLASLRTTARRDGDSYILDGQKVWSSGAHYADHGILLARTADVAEGHNGITCFIVDMRSAGIDVRPLRQLTGGYEFNEVFLDNVRVDASMVLGKLNDGWRTAVATLSHERSMMGARPLKVTMDDLRLLVERHGKRSDPVVRQQVADAFIHISIVRYLTLRDRFASRSATPGPTSSVMKLAVAQLNTRLANLAAEIQGATALLGADEAPNDGRFLSALLSQGVHRIAGGTDEIQRNTIGRAVLGLPSEPRIRRGATSD